MRRALAFPFSALAFAASLAACTSGVLRNAVPGAPQYGAVASGSVTTVTVRITVATKTAASRRHDKRYPRYFSAASKGLLVRAYPHAKQKLIAETAVDVSPGSKACGGKKTTPRTCSATLMLAPGNADDFLIYDYNAKPRSGKFAKSAGLLAYGKLANKKISTSAKKNTFDVFLGGVIAKLGVTPASIAFPGDGQDHSAALMIDPTDYGNKPITAGAKDPYANPITVSLIETGGTGHALLSLDGAPGSTSVTLRYSTDAVEVDYDGGGDIGYGAIVRLAATKVSKTGGATAAVAIAPLLLGSASKDLGTGALALNGNGDFVPIRIGELNAPSGTIFTATSQHCSAIESTMPVTQTSSTSGVFNVIARAVAATPNPSGCVVAVSDGSVELALVVSNTYKGTLGTPVITETPTITASAVPVEITVGPDAAMWFAELNAGQIGRIDATGSSPAEKEFGVPSPAASEVPGIGGINTGSDGKLWWTDLRSRVGSMTATGAGTAYAVTAPSGSPTPQPSMIVAGSDGNLWFSECGGAAIGRVTTAGVLTSYPRSTRGNEPYVALGPDGNVWFTDNANSKVGYVTPSGTITEFPTKTAGAHPWGITAGPDGEMWFTECNGGAGNGAIGKVPIGATSSSEITEYSSGVTGQAPDDITTGPDGALWFAYCFPSNSGPLDGKNVIGRITTSGVITEYAVPSANAGPAGIAAGPDGAIWFTEACTSAIGRIALESSARVRWPNVVRRPNRYGRGSRRRPHGRGSAAR